MKIAIKKEKEEAFFMYEDKMIQCKDCGAEFTFTAGEQEFYAEKGFNEPIRCRDCRQKKKDERRNFQASREEF